MSLRKMLKVSLLMLLAMALAATSAHARLDLFGQLLTSKNQPKPNSGDNKQVVLWTKAKLDAIPYEECINTCNGLCVCTLPYPPELAICVCMLPIKPEAAGKAIPTKTAGDDKQVVLWTEAKLDSIPYEECINTCKGLCACTLPWPPELAVCVCMLPIKPEAAGKAIPTKIAGDEKQVVLWTEAKLDSIPYEECINTCKGLCACTLPWPPELAVCVCMLPIKPEAAGKAIPTKTAGNDKQVVLWTEAKLDSIPYEECINTCKGLCACTLPWPPELAVCVCMLPIKPEAAGKAIPTKTAGSDKQVVLWTEAKLDSIPYEECINTCKGLCACTLPWPPEFAICVCMLPIKPEAASKAIPTKIAGGFIPYPECMKKCDECVVCAIEKALCYCGKNTTSKSKKPAIQNSKVVEESHKKLDSLPKPVATSGGGFIPYPECIEKCDECVICTKIYPIEKALCYCGKNTASNSNKPAIQNLGDDKKVVLWTQAKLHPIPYEKCIQTCEEFCACNIPRPPISPTCFCIPIPAGRALPI